MVKSELIDEIRSKTDIVKVISEYLPLKKRGKNYLGLCPFHPEKDASFTVSPDKQIFHCFGCNQGGNVFAFLMKIDNLSFLEAVAELAGRLGIALPDYSPKAAAGSKLDKYFKLMQTAAVFFHSNLQLAGPAGYLKQRNISDKTCKEFMLGYAPEGWDNLFKVLISKGFSPEEIEAVGLIIKKENKKDYYDRFRSRLVFPIFDLKGHVIAFGGRTLGTDEPKYLNSPETILYQKAKHLFGLNLSRDAIKKQDTAILVEGYFDMITPYASGIANICASLGTALTIEQAKQLFRFCSTAVIAYDADSAGNIAAERSIEVLCQAGLKVKISQLAGGKDPDEIIAKGGKAAFEQIIDNSLPYIEFKIKNIIKKHNPNEIESRAKAIKAIAQVLAKEPEQFVQKEYARLAASWLRVEPDSILLEIRRSLQYNSPGRNVDKQSLVKPHSKLEEAEKTLIALAAQNKETLDRLKSYLNENDFSLPQIKAVFVLMKEVEADNITHFLLENMPEENKNFLSGLLLNLPSGAKDQAMSIFDDCLKVMQENKNKKRLDELKARLREAEASGQEAAVAEILSQIKNGT